MSIMNAMQNGVSGLSAEGQALGVVGDNVANTNTVGFKESRAVFEDVLGGAIGQRDAAGGGVRMARAQQIFAQGSLTNTGQATDLALSGDGFFVVKGSVGGITGNFYTRAGQTTLDANGNLVTPEGMNIQGYAASSAGFSSSVSNIQVPTGALTPKPTSKLSITANLSSDNKTPLLPWDPQSPAATSNMSTSMTVYDSLGTAHNVDVYMRMNSVGSWDYHALAQGNEIAGGPAGQNVDIASGTLTFNAQGQLTASAAVAGGTVSWNNATPNQAIAVDFGTPGTSGVTTQNADPPPGNVSAQSQDGYGSGSLTGIQVDANGIVNGVYSNGQQIPVAKLAVAKFRANEGLGRAGHNLWMATRESGEPALGGAGVGGRASCVSGALEQSNVDIAQQFVDMIAHQRAFQANSKTITTADEMLQELTNLKR
jgi:flagellar hook protein FlgE